MALKHAFQSALADGADATLVRPSNWNADHVIDDNTIAAAKLAFAATSRILGRTTAGAGAGEELTAAQAKSLLAIAAGDVSGLAASATTDTTNASNISSGTLGTGRLPTIPIANGGTNATTARAAAANLATVFILAKSAVSVSAPSDTNEDILATITVPANAMGANGAIRLKFKTAFTNTGTGQRWRVRADGISGTSYVNEIVPNASLAIFEVVIANVNATNSQKAWYSMLRQSSLVGGATTTSAIDTTAQFTIVITAQKDVNTNVATLEEYTCELLSDGT